MTIQIGHMAIHYDGPQFRSPHARHLLESVAEQLQARRERVERQSVIAILIRRWIVAPAMAGIAIGMLMQ